MMKAAVLRALRAPLDRVNDALDALRQGTAARSVLVFD
jgi:Zn-dependent alcohol dehydrogenase